ncbi:MAG: type III secretion system chaperone [Verrucomicrobia bacterium]|nr:type III secretion system chaperone [Verrucomicrobiota bacterium]
MLYEYIVKLQKELDLKEPLGHEGQASFGLMLDDIQISIIDQAPGFGLSATIGSPPTEKREQFFTQMLRGNLFGQATRHAFLGLDETGNNITLQRYHPETATYREFLDAIEDFINAIDFWKNEINNPTPL